MSSAARSVGAIGATRKPWKARMDSTLEAQFELGIRALKFPPWERNLVFLADRKFELDFAWPQWRAAIEIDGHCHRIGARFESDLVKQFLAWRAGWQILRVGGNQVRDGRAFQWAEEFIARVRATRGAV